MSALPEASAPLSPASACPLCRRSNGCALAAGDGDGDRDLATPCWCVAAAIVPEALARAGAIDGGAACVCAACAQGSP